jgi:hypothetical protein
MSAITHRPVLVFGLLLLAAMPCAAQTKPSTDAPAAATFDKLRDVARPGTWIVVKDLSGHSVAGQVESITTDSLRLTVYGWKNPGTHEVKRGDVQTVRKKADSSLNGALLGALAGFGGAIGIAMGGLPDDGYAGFFLLALIPGGGVAGFFVDRAVSDRRLLYAKPSGSSVSFEHALGGNLGVRADVGLVSPSNRRPAPRVAANIVISLGSAHGTRR